MFFSLAYNPNIYIFVPITLPHHCLSPSNVLVCLLPYVYLPIRVAARLQVCLLPYLPGCMQAFLQARFPFQSHKQTHSTRFSPNGWRHYSRPRLSL